jgi:hypothetical protein
VVRGRAESAFGSSRFCRLRFHLLLRPVKAAKPEGKHSRPAIVEAGSGKGPWRVRGGERKCTGMGFREAASEVIALHQNLYGPV